MSLKLILHVRQTKLTLISFLFPFCQFTSEDARNDLDFAGKQMFCNDEEFW